MENIELLIKIDEEQYEFIKQSMTIDKVKDYHALLYDICKHIKNGTPQQKWIPVSERLPEKDGRYWVWAESSYIPDHVDDPNTCEFDREASYIGGTWYGSHIERVIAWMPLPQPYKAESEDK